jgi:hypothetical protein
MENKDNNNDQQKSGRPLSRSEVDQESCMSSHSADSTFTSGSVMGEDVIDIVMDEKATIMRSPEKMESTFSEARQLRGEDAQPAPNELSNGRSRPRVSFSFPGAFRVGDAQQEDSQQQSVSIESVSSEDSEESEVFVIPRASLVEDDKDVEAQNRTSIVNDIPMVVIAKERVDVVDESAAAQPSGKGTSRLFRLSVVACLLLIAGILTGLLIALLERPGGAEGALQNNNGGNGDGGGGGGGSGGGGGGRGGERVLRTIMEFEAIDRDFGLGNSIGN